MGKEGELEINVLNISSGAPDERIMITTRDRISTMINIKTTNITKEAAKKRLFDEVAAVFDDACLW